MMPLPSGARLAAMAERVMNGMRATARAIGPGRRRRGNIQICLACPGRGVNGQMDFLYRRSASVDPRRIGSRTDEWSQPSAWLPMFRLLTIASNQ